MEKWKKFVSSSKVSMAALAVAIILLLLSSVGGAQAALTYLSETYTSRVQMYNIGVSLLENGEKVSWRDYKSSSDGTWEENTGALLEHMLGQDKDLKIGKRYKEELSVTNSGTINHYLRVSICKYWLDAKGNKMQGLSPDLIGLNLVNLGSDWLLDEEASTTERTVLYYNKLLESGKTTPLFADSLAIDSMVATKVTQTKTTEGRYTTIKTSYDYDGVTFCIEAKVDAVQEHNAEDAIWSAWGRKVSVRNNTLELR